jgi:hypothetical protein
VLREQWVPIFDKHHVDLVLQGHDHAYSRTYPMRSQAPVAGAEDGTTYVISVAGDKFCDQVVRDHFEVAFTNTPPYQTIEIDDALKVADRLEITKARAGLVPEVARRSSSPAR